MAKTAFEKLEIYQLAEKLADVAWEFVACWNNFAKDTVGKQLVRAADSISSNIAEGAGRGTVKDQQYFVRIARGSLNETISLLRRAFRRGLLNDGQVGRLKPTLEELGPRLNAYLKYIARPRTPRGPINN